MTVHRPDRNDVARRHECRSMMPFAPRGTADTSGAVRPIACMCAVAGRVAAGTTAARARRHVRGDFPAAAVVCRCRLVHADRHVRLRPRLADLHRHHRGSHCRQVRRQSVCRILHRPAPARPGLARQADEYARPDGTERTRHRLRHGFPPPRRFMLVVTVAPVTATMAGPMQSLIECRKVGPARVPAGLQTGRRQSIRFACTIGVNQSSW